MRRNREPGTRNPLSCPLSKQRMMVCWLTLQILAASPVVKTVFMRSSIPCRPRAGRTSEVSRTPLRKTPQTEIIPDLPLIRPAIVARFAPRPSLTESCRSPSLPSLYRSAGPVQLRLFSQAARPSVRSDRLGVLWLRVQIDEHHREVGGRYAADPACLPQVLRAD